jgi:hypothetical protein
VGIYQILKIKRRLGGFPERQKNPLQAAQTNSTHAPDAVSREYRSKITGRKEYFDV